MLKTLSDIDDVLLAEAQAIVGGPESETVNQALAALIREHRRHVAVENEIQRLAGGAYAGARR